MFKSIERKVNPYKQFIVIVICLLPLFLYFILPRYSEKTILILGDSLCSPYGIGPKDSWVFLLQQQLNNEKYHYKVVNSSTPGDTTEDGLIRLPAELKNAQPTLTIIALGANDAIHGLPIATIKSNLLKLIQLAKQAHSKVLLLGMHMFPNNTLEYANQFQKIYPELSQQEHVALVPFFLKDVEDNPSLMQDDKLHPIKEAEPILLKNVWPEIKKILSKT
jgi:acyl-CoA thioesterase I